MPGPPPQPSVLKIARGNPGKRPLNKREPKPKAAIPNPPAKMKGEALQEWKRVTVEMEAVGMLTHLDRAVLTAYCEAWALWLEAMQDVRARGVEVQGSRKSRIKNPNLVIASDWLKHLHRLATELGLSPASRTRVQVDPKAPAADDLGAFARKRKRT